jgi:hypothetical protein
MRFFLFRRTRFLRRFCCAAAVTLAGWFAPVVVAADLATTLVAPTAPVAPGTSIEIALVSLNPGSLDAEFHPPASLTGDLDAGSGSHPVTLQAIAPAPVMIAPGGFAARRYELHVPTGISGRAILQVTTSSAAILRTVIDVGTAPASVAGPTTPPENPLAPIEAPVASMLSRTFAGRITPNQPIYFIYGGPGPAAKLQFSFDYRLATFSGGQTSHGNLNTLRFGYTQRSLWDIEARSSPFYDTSYMPELAFNSDALLPKERSPWFTWMGYRAGFLHESNGKSDADSRSMNTFYVRPRFLLGSLDSWLIVALPELQAYLGTLDDNPTIKDYRGYGKMKLYIGRNDGPTLTVAAWSGKRFDHGTVQLDLAVPFRAHLLNIESFFMAQYFNGYGESLRTFDRKSDAFRVGIGLVR